MNREFDTHLSRVYSVFYVLQIKHFMFNIQIFKSANISQKYIFITELLSILKIAQFLYLKGEI